MSLLSGIKGSAEAQCLYEDEKFDKFIEGIIPKGVGVADSRFQNYEKYWSENIWRVVEDFLLSAVKHSGKVEGRGLRVSAVSFKALTCDRITGEFSDNSLIATREGDKTLSMQVLERVGVFSRSSPRQKVVTWKFSQKRIEEEAAKVKEKGVFELVFNENAGIKGRRLPLEMRDMLVAENSKNLSLEVHDTRIDRASIAMSIIIQYEKCNKDKAFLGAGSLVLRGRVEVQLLEESTSLQSTGSVGKCGYVNELQGVDVQFEEEDPVLTGSIKFKL